ncbi:hypothetical protein LPMP_131470 [Leishmania panamensis]|uniref:Uncharacterized protein n=1 Tax=Leishmania panamensis TaxID=5679 RepID=A0A088RMV5_LEIPA|nr:hypothetical protein LPMP_131470 [Leishmania panamensis]AIN96574.1 hypothetical protein LPMP_131470 [Leishmania panamensis]
MQRTYTPASHCLGARVFAHLVAALRHQSTRSAAAVAAKEVPSSSLSGGPQTLRIRSRAYGPSSDLLKGIPEYVALNVEATLHPEDAAVLRAVLGFSMPNLASVRVTPVLPHGVYETRAPHCTGAAYPTDIISSTEREVMERCLQEQLTVVANLVVDQVEQRTGHQLDALHVSYADKMKSFSEIVLNSIHDELRQLRVVRERHGSTERGIPSAAPCPSPTALDVETIARLVSARVAEQLAGVNLATPPFTTTTITPTPSSGIAHQLARLEASTAAHFEDLQKRVTIAIEGRDTPAQSSTLVDLRAAVVEAVQKVAAEQQESLSNLIGDLLTDKVAARGSGSAAAANTAFDMRTIEESVENAVQSATNELRRTITSEVKKLAKAKGTGGEVTGGAAVDADMAIEIEKVFDAVQSTQSRLTAVDETVGDVFKEQAATQDALRAMQELLHRQLNELRSTVAIAAAAPASDASEAAQQRIVEALEQLRRDVSATNAALAIHQGDTPHQLMTVAQVVSDSVTAAIQQQTGEAVQSAMSAIQEQLDALREAKGTVSVPAPTPPPPATALPLALPSQEVLTDAVEAVLSPRWAELSVQVEKMNTANQLAIEQKLLHIADSVSTSVAASLQAQLEEMRTAAQNQPRAENGDEEQDSISTNTSPVATEALMEKVTHELTTLREELLQALQVQVGKTPEVNLTPLYKYIDSVLVFMKEELSLQETNLTAKMTSLAETVTAAVHTQQEAASSSASLSRLKEEEQAARELEKEAEASKAAAVADAPPSAAPTAALSDMVELFSPMGAALEAHAAALRRLEERLDEVSRTANVSSVLMRLQAATEQFSSASLAVAAAQTSERDTLQALFQDRITSLVQTLEDRDAQLMEAMRNTATSGEMRTQLNNMQDAIQSMSQAQKEELLASLREAVSGSEKEQAQRSDALLARMAAMQEALQEQNVAVQLLLPSPALIGLSAEQQRAVARIRTATRDRLRSVTQLISNLASAPAGKNARAATKALLDELDGLRQLQDEEAAFVRETSATGAGPVTVQSILQAEVQRVQEEMHKGMQELSSQGHSLQRDIATAVQSLVAKIEDVEGSTSSLPALADIQQLLDATVVRVTSRQSDEGARASQVVEAAATRSAAELRTTVQTALAENVSAAEQRLIPAYHAKVVSTLQTHLTTHSEEIRAAVSGVTDTTTAAVQRIETIARDMTSRYSSAAQEYATSQDAVKLHLSSGKRTSYISLWWLIVNPLLVCLVVLLSMYYVFACLLLAFVPKPSEEGSSAGESATSAAAMAVATGSEPVGFSSETPRKGGRYVDQYM